MEDGASHPGLGEPPSGATGAAVKLVIDLTATHRYYDRAELEEAGVRHMKIATQGRGTPSEGQMAAILSALRELMPVAGASSGEVADGSSETAETPVAFDPVARTRNYLSGFHAESSSSSK